MVKTFIKKNDGGFIRLDLEKIIKKQIPRIVIELEISAVAHNTSISKMKQKQLEFLIAFKIKKLNG